MTKAERDALEIARSRMESGVGQDDDNVAELIALCDRLAKVEEAAIELQDAADDLSCIVNVDAPDTIRYDKAREALRAALSPPTEEGRTP